MSMPSKTLALAIAQTALERKAQDIVVLEVGPLVNYTDYLVVCSGRSDRQVDGLADAIDAAISERGDEPISIEGRQGRNWILMDYGDVVVHIFHEEARHLYDLERLWFDAPKVPLPEEPAAPVAPTADASAAS